MIEGVDFSAHGPGRPSVAALKAAGKHFAVRYLADDWRGIFPDEYRRLTAGGIDVAAVYESTITRWRGRFAAGEADAHVAQGKLLRTGMPAAMPVYFAVDYDAAPSDQDEIDAYLRGAASVIGRERTGVYGGYWVVKRCHENGTAAWYWQTTAWSGGQLHPAAHLYQYAYNVWIDGVNCDNTRALMEVYGQASAFEPAEPEPIEPDHRYPRGIDPALAADWFGVGRLYREDGTRVGFGFHEESAVCQAWLTRAAEEGTYPAAVARWQFRDAPDVLREIVRFANGWTLIRLNNREPWRWADEMEGAA